MAHETDDPSAVPPPVVLPTEDAIRAKIAAVVLKGHRRDREYLDDLMRELTGDARRWVLLALLREYQMQRQARPRRRTRRRAASETRIDAASYDVAHQRLETLLREIEEHPLVYHFCPAHMVRYPKDESICWTHERWSKGCPECHGVDRPRVGKPVNTRRHRLLRSIVPAVRNGKRGDLDPALSLVAAACRCFGEQVTLLALRNQWYLVERTRRRQKLALAAASNTLTPYSEIRVWTPQLPDESACLCRLHFPVT
jgi:hypothetical protein